MYLLCLPALLGWRIGFLITLRFRINRVCLCFLAREVAMREAKLGFARQSFRWTAHCCLFLRSRNISHVTSCFTCVKKQKTVALTCSLELVQYQKIKRIVSSSFVFRFYYIQSVGIINIHCFINESQSNFCHGISIWIYKENASFPA